MSPTDLIVARAVAGILAIGLALYLTMDSHDTLTQWSRTTLRVFAIFAFAFGVLCIVAVLFPQAATA